jgi:hypothetical protein
MKPSEYLEKNKIVTGKKPVGTWVFINRMDKQFFDKDELIDIKSRLQNIEILLFVVLSFLGWIITNNIVLGYISLTLIVILVIFAYTTIVKELRNYIRGKV